MKSEPVYSRYILVIYSGRCCSLCCFWYTFVSCNLQRSQM